MVNYALNKDFVSSFGLKLIKPSGGNIKYTNLLNQDLKRATYAIKSGMNYNNKNDNIGYMP